MMDKELVGIEMQQIFAISKTHLKRRAVVFITPLHSRFNFYMMKTKSIWHIATHIRIQMLLNCFRGYVNLSPKIEYVRPLCVKL